MWVERTRCKTYGTTTQLHVAKNRHRGAVSTHAGYVEAYRTFYNRLLAKNRHVGGANTL